MSHEPGITEVSSPAAPHLDAAHPDFVRWQRAAAQAELRGDLVCTLLAKDITLEGARILDAGCGVGGTSIALRKHGAVVCAMDRSSARLEQLRAATDDIDVREGDLSSLPFGDASFDAVVLQDVIEHVTDPARVLHEITRVLRPGGVLYLSTPNRDALPNLVADPHFGLPLVSRKSREQLRSVLRRHRPADAERDDIAQLLSARQLDALLRAAGLRWRYVNRAAAGMLFSRPETVVWSDLHLRAVRVLRRTGLWRPALSMVSDRPGVFNRWINPTWYLLARKDAL
jgi:ubiquinone/menaquinone biosynthesis C-methylase UbiE